MTEKVRQTPLDTFVYRYRDGNWLIVDHHLDNIATPWLGFAVLLLAVVAIGFALGLYGLPYWLGWFVGALVLAGVGVLLIAPKLNVLGQAG